MGDRWFPEFLNSTDGSAEVAFAVIMVVIILTILGSMQVFVLILSLVNQGLVYHTEVPVTRILWSMSGTNQFGYACAQAVIFGAILITVSFGLKKMSNLMKQAITVAGSKRLMRISLSGQLPPERGGGGYRSGPGK